MTTATKKSWLVLGLVWSLAALAVLPVLLHWTARPPSSLRSYIAAGLALMLAVAFCAFIFRREARRVGRAAALTLAILVFLQANFAYYTHRYLVDRAQVYSRPTSTEWQQSLQNDVVHLSPEVVPHSYRFLPNAVVFWMQIFGVRFEFARDIFRFLAGLLLFYAIYRYARLYGSHRAGLFAMLLVGLVYPTSFVAYGGQLTDPLSHLSFVLAFIFLETEEFAFLLTTLLLGSLTKETVLALCGFYALFRRGEARYKLKAAFLCAASFAAYFGVRMFVLHGSMQYRQVSNVHIDHVSVNWHQLAWPSHFLTTALAYTPFLFLGWKTTPAVLKQMVFYLFPVLFLSSLFFSWLNETRNFMPVVFVLAVIAGRYFDAQPASAEEGAPISEA